LPGGCRTSPRGERAHLRGRHDGVTALAPIGARFPDLAELLASEEEADLFASPRAAESIGRPLGDDCFLVRVEKRTGGFLKQASVGRNHPLRKTADRDMAIKCTAP